MNHDIHEHVSDYLDRHLRSFITEDFIYASYNSPNTMYQVSNDLDEILLKLSQPAYKVWHRTMTLVKRNRDPVLACTVIMKHEYYKDLVGRSSYYKAVNELVEHELLIATEKRSLKIVNVRYANKLFKPQLPEEDKNDIFVKK